MQNSVSINRLPAITWYWLKMNETVLEDTTDGTKIEPVLEAPKSVTVTQEAVDPLSQQPTGGGEAASAWIDAGSHAIQVLETKEGDRGTGSVRYTVSYDEQTGQRDALSLRLAKNSELTVVMDLHSSETAGGLAGLRTRFAVGENAVLRLVQVLRPGRELTMLNDIGGACAENGRVEIVHLFLGAGKILQGCRVDLAGEKSSLQTDIAYRTEGDGRLDMNYLVEHTGKKTTSAIDVNGVLRGRASKIFRGTIDFVKGASGAVGNEMENVLLMEDTVHNQTIPLILCAEEDVVGNHGATIGRLDENLLFYMESRGMAKEEIYELVARARVEALVQKIPDAALREELCL